MNFSIGGMSAAESGDEDIDNSENDRRGCYKRLTSTQSTILEK